MCDGRGWPALPVRRPVNGPSRPRSGKTELERVATRVDIVRLGVRPTVLFVQAGDQPATGKHATHRVEAAFGHGDVYTLHEA